MLNVVGILCGGLSASAVVVTGIITKQNSKRKTKAIKSKTWVRYIAETLCGNTVPICSILQPCKRIKAAW